MDSAAQPFTDPEGYLRQRLLDDEEERKKKEREDAAKAALEQQQAQQKAIDDAQQAQQQTANGPVAPGQTVAQVPAGMAAPNPYGSAIAQGQTSEGPPPAQGGPAPQVQEQGNIEQQRQVQQAAGAAPQMTMEERIAAAAQRAQERATASSQGAPQAAPAPAPQAPVQQAPAPQAPVAAPAVPEMPQAQMAAPAAPQLPQPGPGIQVASTEPAAGVVEAAQAAQQPPSSPWAGKLEAGKNDLTQLGSLLANPDVPEDIKLEAQDRLLNMKLDREQQKKVEKIVSGVEKNDPRAINDLTRELKSRTEEGSYVKAILFARLGLNKLADEEQMKLGGGTTYTSFTGPDNQNYTLRVNGRGGIEKAFDSSGKVVDENTLAGLNANYLSMKGAVTGQTFHKNLDNGHTISHTVLPGGRGVQWKDETTGRLLSSAPSQLSTISYVSPTEKASVSAGKSVMDKMRAENTKSEAQGAGPKFSEEQIQAAGDAASSAVLQGRGAPGAAATSVVGAATGFSDPSIRILSGARTTAEQSALYQQSVDNGTPGVLPNGNPVAKPGTSKHETNGAIDVDTKSLTTEGRRELALKGYYQPLANDPNHWELLPGREAPVAATKTAASNVPPASAAIRQQAEAIFNGDEKAPSGMGANNYRARAVMDEVRRIAEEQGKTYDPTLFVAKEKTRKDFSGSGQASKTVQAMNVAIDHLDTLHEAGVALQNGQIPVFNKVANMYAKNTGQPEPTDFDSLKSIVGSEVAKAVAGGATALGDREEIRKEISGANSPQQLAGVIQKYQKLLGGQLTGLRTTYESAGLKDFDTKLNDRTKQVLMKSEKQPKSTRSSW